MGPVTRILEQTLWLAENSEINKNRMKRAKKGERWKVLCKQMWTRCRLGRVLTLFGAITVTIVLAETFRTKQGFPVISVFPSLIIVIDCLFHAALRPLFLSSFPLEHRFPLQQETGFIPRTFVVTIGSLWELFILARIGLTGAWVAAMHFGGVLLSIALLKMVSLAMKSTDFINNAFWGKTLVKCHQTLLEAIDRINSMTLLPNFALINCNFVVCLIVMYCILTDNLIPPMIVSFWVTLTAMTGLGILSEALIKENERVGEAIYQSDWSSSLIGRSGELKPGQIASLKQALVMVQIRASRPLCLEVLFFGKTGHAFLIGYFKTFYSYFQALLTFL